MVVDGWNMYELEVWVISGGEMKVGFKMRYVLDSKRHHPPGRKMCMNTD